MPAGRVYTAVITGLLRTGVNPSQPNGPNEFYTATIPLTSDAGVGLTISIFSHVQKRIALGIKLSSGKSTTPGEDEDSGFGSGATGSFELLKLINGNLAVRGGAGFSNSQKLLEPKACGILPVARLSAVALVDVGTLQFNSLTSFPEYGPGSVKGVFRAELGLLESSSAKITRDFQFFPF